MSTTSATSVEINLQPTAANSNGLYGPERRTRSSSPRADPALKVPAAHNVRLVSVRPPPARVPPPAVGPIYMGQAKGPQWGKPKATDGKQVELVSPVTLSCLRQESKVVNGEQVELVSPVILSCLRQEPMGRSMGQVERVSPGRVLTQRQSGGATVRDQGQLATAPTALGPNRSPRESVAAAFVDVWRQRRLARWCSNHLLPGRMALAPWANPTWEQQLQQQLTRTRP